MRTLLCVVVAASLPVGVSLRTGQYVPDQTVAIVQGGFEITAPGFLPRRVASSEGRIQWLWPDDAQLPAWFTFEGLHNSNPDNPTNRPALGVMTVEPSADLMSDPAAWSALKFAISNINSVYLRGEFRYQLVAPGQGGQVTIYRDPDDPLWRQRGYEHAGAVAYAWVDGQSIVRNGKILFRDFARVFPGSHLAKAMSHELAHIAGMRGHPKGIPGISEDGVMSNPNELPTRFTGPEEDLLRWLFMRRPGVRWPDDTIPQGVRLTTRDSIIVIPLCVISY